MFDLRLEFLNLLVEVFYFVVFLIAVLFRFLDLFLASFSACFR